MAFFLFPPQFRYCLLYLGGLQDVQEPLVAVLLCSDPDHSVECGFETVAVADPDKCAVLQMGGDPGDQRSFRDRVQAFAGFVEDRDRSLAQQGAGDGEASALAAGEAGAAFLDPGFHAGRPALYFRVESDQGQDGAHFLFGESGVGQAQVVGEGSGLGPGVLADAGDLSAQGAFVEVRQRDAADMDRSALRFFEAGEQLDQGAFSPAAGALQENVFAGGDGKVEAVEDRRVPVPGEAERAYLDAAVAWRWSLGDVVRRGWLAGDRLDALGSRRGSRQIERGIDQREQRLAARQQKKYQRCQPGAFGPAAGGEFGQQAECAPGAQADGDGRGGPQGGGASSAAALECQPVSASGQSVSALACPGVGVQREILQSFAAVEKVGSQGGASFYLFRKNGAACLPAEQRQEQQRENDQQHGEPGQRGNGGSEDHGHEAENECGRQGRQDQARIEIVERVDIAHQSVKRFSAVPAGDLARRKQRQMTVQPDAQAGKQAERSFVRHDALAPAAEGAQHGKKADAGAGQEEVEQRGGRGRQPGDCRSREKGAGKTEQAEIADQGEDAEQQPEREPASGA